MTNTTLGAIVEEYGGLIQTGPFGSQLHQHEYTDDGVPVVMPKDIQNGRIDVAGIARIPEHRADELSRHSLKPDSIVFPRRGQISKCAYIVEQQAGFLCGTGCIKIEPPEGRLRAKFLYYHLGLRRSVEWLERNAVGTTMLNLSAKILAGLPVPTMAVHRQDAVVGVLTAYDDLIENNRRRIELLEQAARLLYKEWFVHLRFPGHEHVEIVDGVPSGWEKMPLGSLCSLRAGNVFKPQYQGQERGDLPFIKVRDMNSPGNLIAITEANNWVSMDAAEEFRGKTFPAGTSVFAKIGEALRQNRVRYLAQETLIDNNLMGAMPRVGVVDTTFLFYLLVNSDLAVHAGGAAVPFFTQKVLNTLPMLVPDKTTQSLFGSIVGKGLEQTVTLAKHSSLLAQARDLLLPRLMSGEISV